MVVDLAQLAAALAHRRVLLPSGGTPYGRAVPPCASATPTSDIPGRGGCPLQPRQTALPTSGCPYGRRRWLPLLAALIAGSPTALCSRSPIQGYLVGWSSPKAIVVSETSSGKNTKRKIAPTGQISRRDRSWDAIMRRGTIEATREFYYFSAYIRLRELHKSEDKAE
ncbi:hypothetical protein B296_00045984 [Ensete ventricosum]|uniref:Uncharacterized protein n=1 Tax=Ensete ventricosum TaxID=4639 RepID=A0A426XCG9_ENSVE|nr:hypothetical protein B296_00045984 [Ensete ventricosum]